MKVLVIGSGGKEHAIVWKLSQSRHVTNIYCAPGNAGMAEIAECIDVKPTDFNTLIDFVKYEWIDLTIVDTPALLSQGIVDMFLREGCKIFGPEKGPAEISASRVFTKELMKRFGIPTAEYTVFSSYLHALDFVRLKGAPLVIKTAGHAPATDVFLAQTVDRAVEILRLIMKDSMLGEAGRRVLIERPVEGQRFSYVAITDGSTILPLSGLSVFRESGDAGTDFPPGDAGALSSARHLSPARESAVTEKILRPLLKAMRSKVIPYRGILSLDLVFRNGIPFVCELHSSFQNLEAQTVLPRLGTDYVDLLSSTIKERLAEVSVSWEEDASLCIAVFSEYRDGLHSERPKITGLEKIKNLKDIMVFHEDTAFDNHDTVVAGSKVMSVTATGPDLGKAGPKAYDAVGKIQFKGKRYRKNLGDPTCS